MRAAAAAFRAAEREHVVDTLSEGLTDNVMRAADDVYKTPVLQRNALFPSSSVRGGGAASGSSRAGREWGVRFSAGDERMELFGENDDYRKRFSNCAAKFEGLSGCKENDEVSDEGPDESYDNREGQGNMVAEDATGERPGTIGHSSMSKSVDERGYVADALVQVKSENMHVDAHDYSDVTSGKDLSGGRIPVNNGLAETESNFALEDCTEDSVQKAVGQNGKTVCRKGKKVSNDGSSREIKKEQSNELDCSSTREASKRKRPRLNEVLRLQKSLETARWTNAKAVREQSEVIVISDDESPTVHKSGGLDQRTISRRKRRKRKQESQMDKDEAKGREEGGSVWKGRMTAKKQTRAKKDELEDVSSGDEVETKLTEDEWEALLQGWVIMRKIERNGTTNLKAEKVKTMIQGPFGLGEGAGKVIGESDKREARRIRRRRLFEKNIALTNSDPERTDSEALSCEDVKRKVSLRKR